MPAGHRDARPVPPDLDGPHHLLHCEQERCVVQGRRIDGSGQCTVIVIRDRKRHGWVLYPHGAAALGVLIAADVAHTLADRLGGRDTSQGNGGS